MFHRDLSVLIMFSTGNVPEVQRFLVIYDQRQRERKGQRKSKKLTTLSKKVSFDTISLHESIHKIVFTFHILKQ